MTLTETVLKFPKEHESHKYLLIHFRFFLQYAVLAGVQIEYVDSDDTVFIGEDNDLYFSCLINNQQVIFDYSDHYHKDWCDQFISKPYFKFQSTYESNSCVIPLGPPIVGVKNQGTRGETMRSFMHVREHYDYKPGSRVLCKQIPNGAATDRRNHVHKLISDNFTDYDTDANVDQMEFWKMHEHGTVAVCVPGATNNMIDRGQMELFGLGVCTVSPRLDTRIANGVQPIPTTHYLECADDYSDLVDVINRAISNPEQCKHIGSAARTFFDENFLPTRYWTWILKNLSK